MGYRSEVRLLMGPKAYELLKNNCKNSIDKIAQKALDDAEIETGIVYYNEKDNEKEDAVYIKWHDVKWYEGYEDVDIIMTTLQQLDDLDYDSNKLSEYFYKFMEIGEDDENNEQTNDDCGDYTADYYITCSFSQD